MVALINPQPISFAWFVLSVQPSEIACGLEVFFSSAKENTSPENVTLYETFGSVSAKKERQREAPKYIPYKNSAVTNFMQALGSKGSTAQNTTKCTNLAEHFRGYTPAAWFRNWLFSFELPFSLYLWGFGSI